MLLRNEAKLRFPVAVGSEMERKVIFEGAMREDGYKLYSAMKLFALNGDVVSDMTELHFTRSVESKTPKGDMEVLKDVYYYTAGRMVSHPGITLTLIENILAPDLPVALMRSKSVRIMLKEGGDDVEFINGLKAKFNGLTPDEDGDFGFQSTGILPIDTRKYDAELLVRVNTQTDVTTATSAWNVGGQVAEAARQIKLSVLGIQSYLFEEVRRLN